MDSSLILILAGVLAMVGAQHALVVFRKSGLRDHLWFGAMSIAAAGAALAQPVVWPGVLAMEQGTRVNLATVSAAAWLLAATWLGAASAGPGLRRLARIVTLLVALGCVSDVMLLEGRSPSTSFAWGLAGFSASIIALVLVVVVRGALLAGSSGRWQRLASLAAVGTVVLVFALQGSRGSHAIPTMSIASLLLFLVAALAKAYVLAGTVANSELSLQRQQQELAHASRLSIVGELTASIAHQISQPLGAIMSNADAAEMLLEGPAPPLDEIRRIVADVRRDGLRASDVIRHVRALVRKREMALERVDAKALVSDVVALLESEARRRRVPVACSLTTQAADLLGDRALLEQVLINLVLNAMDSVEALQATTSHLHGTRAPILLGVAVTGNGEVELTVVDEGHGIPDQHLKHLFTSFHTSKPHGMGLGLSIARSIVEAHGGRIHARNNDGAGARFSITIPPYRDSEVPDPDLAGVNSLAARVGEQRGRGGHASPLPEPRHCPERS